MISSDDINTVLPQLKAMHQKMGYQENSTGILFDNYLNQGIGAYPVIAGYESQVIEFYKQNEEIQDRLMDQISIFIPEPTIWSNHTFIAISDAGEKLMHALMDEKIQEIAWESYGFRTGVAGINLDTRILQSLGLPEKILNSITSPSGTVLEQLISALE
jgi:hypothetical protein